MLLRKNRNLFGCRNNNLSRFFLQKVHFFSTATWIILSFVLHSRQIIKYFRYSSWLAEFQLRLLRFWNILNILFRCTKFNLIHSYMFLTSILTMLWINYYCLCGNSFNSFTAKCTRACMGHRLVCSNAYTCISAPLSFI